LPHRARSSSRARSRISSPALISGSKIAASITSRASRSRGACSRSRAELSYIASCQLALAWDQRPRMSPELRPTQVSRSPRSERGRPPSGGPQRFVRDTSE
jgi:hypothetical protein